MRTEGERGNREEKCGKKDENVGGKWKRKRSGGERRRSKGKFEREEELSEKGRHVNRVYHYRERKDWRADPQRRSSRRSWLICFLQYR